MSSGVGLCGASTGGSVRGDESIDQPVANDTVHYRVEFTTLFSVSSCLLMRANTSPVETSLPHVCSLNVVWYMYIVHFHRIHTCISTLSTLEIHRLPRSRPLSPVHS